jgi:HTH-type transcriptional regulator/antitoxin HigA
VLLTAFDEENPEFSDRTPLETLRFLMEENNVPQSEISQVVGSRAYASQILTGKRAISAGVAAKLGQRFGLPPGAFLP